MDEMQIMEWVEFVSDGEVCTSLWLKQGVAGLSSSSLCSSIHTLVVEECRPR